MAKTRRFVIQRRNGYELTTVGTDGQKHVNSFELGKRPKGVLFKDEGQYRRAIDKAVRAAKQADA